MNWDDARLFLAVVRAGQMLGAARRLHLNQATLSRRIAALERELDTPLLIRHAQGCSPTEQGRQLIAHLERAENAMLQAQSALGDSDNAIAGTVRIGAPDGLGIAFLTRHLTGLTDRYPELSVQLVPIPRTFSLSEREADVAIMVGRPRASRLVVRRLTDYSVHLYAAERYLARRGAVEDLSQLLDASHDVVGYVDDLLYAPGLNYTQALLGKTRPRIEIASAIGQLEAVRAGVGIGMLHDYLVSPDDALQQVLPEHGATRTYWLAYHESMRHISRVQVVVRYLIDLIETHRAQFMHSGEQAR